MKSIRIGIVAISVLIAIIMLGCGSSMGGESAPIKTQSDGKRTFVMIHFEAGYRACKDNNLPPGLTLPENVRSKDFGWQEKFWPTAIELVEKANEYGFKLTLAFNPQWGQFIASDSTRLSLVRQWQAQGHEIGFHHHGKTHVDWNGYSNESPAVNDPLYLGQVNSGFSYVNALASPAGVFSSTLTGPPVDYPSLMTAPAGENIIFGVGNQHDSYPELGTVKSLKPVRIHTPARDWVELTTREFSTVMGISLGEAFPILQEQYGNLKEDEVFGIVWHEFDYFQAKGSYMQWFDFINKNGSKVKTMREIAGEYFQQ